MANKRRKPSAKAPAKRRAPPPKKTKAPTGTRDKYGRFAPKNAPRDEAGRPINVLRGAPVRDSKGHFKTAAGARKRTKGSVTLDPDELIKEIADLLELAGFDIEDYHAGENVVRDFDTGRDEVYHTYQVEFGDSYDIEPEMIASAFEPFQEVLGGRYRRDTILKVFVGVLDPKTRKLDSERWANVSANQTFNDQLDKLTNAPQSGAFSSVAENVREWVQRSSYSSFTAVSCQTLAPAWTGEPKGSKRGRGKRKTRKKKNRS